MLGRTTCFASLSHTHAGAVRRGTHSLAMAMVALLVFASMATAAQASPEITISRYRVLADGQPSGWSEFIEFRRSDGSVTYLMIEYLGFFGGGLDRFVTASFTADGDFDGGHWIATSRDGGDFEYAYSHDGRTLVGRAHTASAVR